MEIRTTTSIHMDSLELTEALKLYIEKYFPEIHYTELTISFYSNAIDIILTENEKDKKL